MGYSDQVDNITGASGGQMMMRIADSAGQAGVINGNDIQFFIRSGLSSTFVGSPGFALQGYWNGTWNSLSNLANYSGTTDWRHVGTITITNNQTIGFRMPNASGTSGFGGPHTMYRDVTRATVPAAPTMLSPDTIGHTSARIRFSGNSNGGSSILEWQIGYGTSSTTVQFTVGSSGTTTVSGLSIGTTWYFWARGRNAVGWGPWSSRVSVRTLSSGRVRVVGTWREMILYVKVAGVWRQAIIYNKVAGVWVPARGN